MTKPSTYARFALTQTDNPLKLLGLSATLTAGLTGLLVSYGFPESWGTLAVSISGIVFFVVAFMLLTMYLVAPIAGIHLSRAIEKKHGAKIRNDLLTRSLSAKEKEAARESEKQAKKRNKKPKKLRQGRR
jgi:hypothetical protein